MLAGWENVGFLAGDSQGIGSVKQKAEPELTIGIERNAALACFALAVRNGYHSLEQINV